MTQLKSGLAAHIVAVRQRLAAGLEELRRRHEAGCAAAQSCAEATALWDTLLRELFETACDDLAKPPAGDLRSQVVLVAHGGYGRGDVAPYSDVDMMLLHTASARNAVTPLADRLLRDVFDAGFVFGHSARTPEQAAGLAGQDPVIATSLIESRRLVGDEALFVKFQEMFRRQVRRQPQRLMGEIVAQRQAERARFGETVYLLEPNVKRSRGGLRDLQLVRWIGLVRYGVREPALLRQLEVLSDEDLAAIQQSAALLLRLRNELHFHAGRPADVLDRAEQLRIADRFGYQPTAGMLAVERLMQDYFRATNAVSHLASRFVAHARAKGRLTRLVTAVFGHHVEADLQVGPAGILATPRGLERARGDLAVIMRMVDLSNLYDKPIADETWEAIRREAPQLPREAGPEACRHFLSVLAHPARLDAILRDLHDTAVLERFVPAMAHARGLLQFNQYHKYTVDEHCLQAVGFTTKLMFDMGTLGRVYRQIAEKHVLHLALLIHDLGKGHEEDHHAIGARIARQTAERLGMPPRDAETLEFLVKNHSVMNYLAFRRDAGDQQLVVQFALQVGSPERLRMLFVLTAADLAAVGPGVWDQWKSLLLTDLLDRTMEHLAGESPATSAEAQTARRDKVRKLLGPDSGLDWFARQIGTLPAGYLGTTEPEQIAADLRMLHGLKTGDVVAEGCYLPGTETAQFVIGTSEATTPGAFHKLTGALTSQGLQIRSAQINTLADALVLDRFWVRDPDYPQGPPPDRIDRIRLALTESLQASGDQPPAFRRTWQESRQAAAPSPNVATRISVDNTTSQQYTILDIFASDRSGLLYAVTRTLFELGLSVWRAKVGTYGDQVVDVFYVTDQHGQKIHDEPRLEEIRRRVLEVIRSG